MYKSSRTKLRFLLTAVILFTSLAGTSIVYAGDPSDPTPTPVPDPLEITKVDPSVGECGDVTFTIEWTDVSESYQFEMDFDDGPPEIITVEDPSWTISHTYTFHGDYEWTVRVGTGDQEVIMTGLLTLEGPEVVLSVLPSSSFPPLFVLGDPHTVDFKADVTGGTPPFDYLWVMDGDEDKSFESETLDTYAKFDERSSTYTKVDKYYPQVTVTDWCDFTSSDTMPVVVADPEDACHPMAQKIAEGINYIFPDQADKDYTCDDISAIFDNESEENNLGFGLMWKAYHLALTMEELTWEDIMDWKLDQSGWGALLQLDRFADLLADHDLVELMDRVMSEEYTLGDVRVAVRSTTRYEADFEDALARITDGANPGELGQFYKLVNELDADPAELDGYLTLGLTLSELKHAASFADQMEVDWDVIADARVFADSWGDLKQAYNLATDEMSATQILIDGVQEYRKSLQEDALKVREEKQATQQDDKNQGTALKLEEQFSAVEGAAMLLFDGICESNWGCVRKALRTQTQSQTEGFSSDKDRQVAQQIAVKYGPSGGEEEVLAYHAKECNEDWACTRTHFRELYMLTRENGKPDKTGKPE